ncbi:uncharacterized protein NECHADRAFT_36784 [Fusarium vanettenii 77-13-4]|uniref:Uncharacterized protein n=1 Tax=Fusarium vanettenii (strain ATCC MYA-4622 / CBS 123669 / FGSC 9596 / NRRL 45880 / 77-13-4) TaxID=660122 RepID=C7YNB2_FUSV7|nr:uncharacterized protein NECHADRAFT_36784 [Fusarium vanettenii 77-13-4]EEU47095.1 hypothetical protein NECHADRAFT_36784 [Fusarium vanettenii 77-13-4]
MSSNTTPSSVTATATATATGRINLASPYEPPRSCQSNWSQTSVIWTEDWSSTVPVLVSDPIASCYPSGWDDTQAKNRFSFRPAVCPTGWTYWDMGRVADSSEIASTAYCCERFLASTLLPNQCGRWIESKAEESEENGATTATASALDQDDSIIPPDGTLIIHQAWAITWASSDRTHLSPQPPTLTNNELIPSWKPPEFVPTTRPAQENPDTGQQYISNSAVWFLMVGLPIIVVFLFAGLCFWGIRRRRRRAAVMTPQAGVGDSSAKSGGRITS